MSEYIKAWTSVLFLVVEVFVMLGILSATMTASEAERYHAQVIKELENSNFNDGVILACYEEARERGYELRIGKCVIDENKNRQVAEVELEYRFCIGLLGIDRLLNISGMAG